MRAKRKLLVLAPAFALATIGLAAVLPGQALAGTGISQNCTDGDNDVLLLSNPITLGIESAAFVNHSVPTYVMLCYSTSPAGSTAPTLAGGGIGVNVAQPGSGSSGTDCTSDAYTNPLTNVACQVQVSPSASYSAGANGGTLTVAIPIQRCLGTALGSIDCETSGPSLANTGVIIGTIVITGPPSGYSTGGGVALTSLNLYVAGQSEPIPLFNGTTQAGVNTGIVSTQTGGGGFPFCVPDVGCQTLPTAALVRTSSGSIAGIVILGVFVPAPGLPSECLSVGVTC